MYRKIIAFLLTFVLVVTTFLPMQVTAASKTPYAKNGQLAVSNGKIVNKKKQPFVIKGVSTHGLAWYPQYVNEKAFRTLRDKYGVNTIRLAMYTEEYNGYCNGGNKKELEKTIGDGVKYAKKLGMYVIIDWHILSDGNPDTHEKQALSFFKKMAKKYKKYGNVLFEICNEPNGSEGSWENIRSYAKKVIKKIRKVNKKAIIIVGTPTWSQDIENAMEKPITGYKNIAYSYHFYAGTHKEDMRKRLAAALQKSVPVIVTEFGISDASGNGGVDATEGRKWMALLDKYKTGRVCWNLSNKNESSSIIKSSCNKLSGWGSSDLTATGKFLLKTYTGKSLATADKTVAEDTVSETDNQQNINVVTDQSNVTENETGPLTGEISISASSGWDNGNAHFTQYNIVIKNTGGRTFKDWIATVIFDQSVSVEQSWCGTVKQSDSMLTITPEDYNQKLKPGEAGTIGVILSTTKEVGVLSKNINIE